jgi:hypothetical protein
MPFRASRTLLPLTLLALTLASASTTACADEPAPSLYERRLGIIKGTSKGVVLWEPEKNEPPAATKPSNGKVEAGADGKPVSAAPQVPAKSGFLSMLPPPSGRSMADARRLGAPGGGIPVSTANKAAQPEPAEKP